MTKIFQIITFIAVVIFSQKIDAQRITNKDIKVDGNIYHISIDDRINAMLSAAEESCRRSFHTETNTSTNPINKIDICKESSKLMGYKIQIAITQDGNEANRIRYRFGQKFPELKIEVDTNIRPNHKILAGSYFSKISGTNDLERVKREFRNAILVPYRIFCEESI